MIHARPDYNGRIQDSQGVIPKDEPVFLIRGQDAAAADTVEFWAQRNDAIGGDPELSKLARQHAELMRKWPAKKKADL